jgi:hypothetical protein
MRSCHEVVLGSEWNGGGVGIRRGLQWVRGGCVGVGYRICGSGGCRVVSREGEGLREWVYGI